MLTHSGEKPHKCALCNFSSNQASNLRTHIITHTGARHHQCNQCNFSSNQLMDLRRHSYPHWRKVPSMWPVRLCLKSIKFFNATQNDPLWGKTSQMFTVWLFKHHKRSFDNPHGKSSYQRKTIEKYKKCVHVKIKFAHQMVGVNTTCSQTGVLTSSSSFSFHGSQNSKQYSPRCPLLRNWNNIQPKFQKKMQNEPEVELIHSHQLACKLFALLAHLVRRFLSIGLQMTPDET